MKKILLATIVGLAVVAQLMPVGASAACISVSGNLYRGMRGSDVRALQEFLVGRGYPGGGDWMITGYFGPATQAAVRNFQREMGLAVTGTLDTQTRDAITRTSCGVSGGTTYQNAYPYAYNYVLGNYGYPGYTYPTSLYGTPILTALSVNTGGPGTYVTIWGSGFDLTNNTVYFGTTPLAGIASTNGTSLAFTVPAYAGAAGNVDVKVWNTRGLSNALAFNMTGAYYYYPTYPYGCGIYPYTGTNCGGTYWGGTPVISYLSPTTGAVGTTVTIYGTGFTQTGNTVRFGNGIIANIGAPDGRALSFTVPATLTGYGTQPVTLATYDVSVTNGEGRTSNTLPFTVTSLGTAGQPTITNITGPTSLAAGTTGTWTITANNPGGGYLSVSVDWGDAGMYAAAAAPQATYLTSQTLTYTHTYYQQGTYTIRFTVTNAMGQTNTTTTTVNVTGTTTGTVTLTGLTPTSGRVGALVTLTGTGFTQDNTVHFGIGGTQHLPSYNGTTIYYTVPSYVSPCDLLSSGAMCGAYAQLITPGAYQMYVTNGNGTTQALTFTVLQ